MADETAVSIRAPVKGAIHKRPPRPPQLSRFNPRPREGGDGEEVRLVLGSGVSIRAPVKGAMFLGVADGSGFKVSIRAPVKGAIGRGRGCGEEDAVSIRAPVKGAICQGYRVEGGGVFQSAPP